MATQKPYEGVYAGIEFAPYSYQHYPLMVTKFDDKGKILEQKIVEDEDEEEAANADGFVSPKVGPVANLTVDEASALHNENEALRQQLAEAHAKLAEKAAPVPAKPPVHAPPAPKPPHEPGPPAPAPVKPPHVPPGPPVPPKKA